jgi:hypothetical protein
MQSITITIFLLSTFFLNQPIAKAHFTPPSTSDWLGSEETSGIFSSGQIIFNITSGPQYYPTYPQIKFRSNNSEAINLGICVADFRLLRVNENNTLTETDYARLTINSVGKMGWFWASTIMDYPSTFLFGLVVWNASDGSVIGRLIKTIQASDERVFSLTSDKELFGASDRISFAIVNHGSSVWIFPSFSVYRISDGDFFVGPDYGGVIVDFGFKSVGHNETYRFEVSRLNTDFTQSGVYRLIIGGPFLYLSTDFGVVGVAGSGSTPPSSAVDRGAWMLGGALTGAIVGSIVYYYSRKRV